MFILKLFTIHYSLLTKKAINYYLKKITTFAAAFAEK